MTNPISLLWGEIYLFHFRSYCQVSERAVSHRNIWVINSKIDGMSSLFPAVRWSHTTRDFGSLLRLSTRVHLSVSPTVKGTLCFKPWYGILLFFWMSKFCVCGIHLPILSSKLLLRLITFSMLMRNDTCCHKLSPSIWHRVCLIGVVQSLFLRGLAGN
jgi:hypothetical protein